MTRYNYFNVYYPEEAKKISEGYSSIPGIVWNGFTRVTGLNKFFSFTPHEITNNPDKDKIQGTVPTPPWYSDEINL